MKTIISITLCAIILLAITAVMPVVSSADENAYYIDSINGDDNGDGRTPETAWKTLVKTRNAPAFQPGDKILLKRGCVWDDQFLMFKGSGNTEKQITVDAYGEGALPMINANGVGIDDGLSSGAAVYLNSQSYITVRNLEVTNAKDMNIELAPKDRTGIFAGGSGSKSLKGIIIENNYVHHIGKIVNNYNTYWAAISFFSRSWSAGFSECIIRNNTVHDSGGGGIHISGMSWIDNGGKDNIIENNYIYNTGTDGITVISSVNTLVQNNIVDTSHRTKDVHSSGIWPYESDDTLIQYNESFNTKNNK